MTDRRQFKLGDTITMTEAVALYAERDMRPNDDSRGAKSRSRGRIGQGIKEKVLKPASADGKTFRIEHFVSWAMLDNPDGPEHKRRGQPTAWVGKYADIPWQQRFEGLYEAPRPVVEDFGDLKVKYQYSDEQRLRAFLGTPVAAPVVDAPQEWVDALAVACCQIDLFRGLVAELSKGKKSEERVTKALEKLGATPA